MIEDGPHCRTQDPGGVVDLDPTPPTLHTWTYPSPPPDPVNPPFPTPKHTISTP